MHAALEWLRHIAEFSHIISYSMIPNIATFAFMVLRLAAKQRHGHGHRRSKKGARRKPEDTHDGIAGMKAAFSAAQQQEAGEAH